MPLVFLIVAVAFSLVLIMAIAWALAVSTGKSGWIDSIWPLSVGGIGVVAALSPLPYDGPSTRQWIVAGLAAFWSLRLGSHILRRTLNGGDDPRYADLKKQWGEKSRSKLFWFVQIQAVVAVPLVVSIAVAGHNPAADLGIGDWLGIAILLIAICGESIADSQLKTFAADPANKTKVCNVGLWSLSRHPNFFFEWLGWIAYPCIAIGFDASYWQGWIALAGPAVMYWLLVHVSGIPPLEAHMLRSRGDAFKSYQLSVNAFWLGPAKTMTKPSSQSLS